MRSSAAIGKLALPARSRGRVILSNSSGGPVVLLGERAQTADDWFAGRPWPGQAATGRAPVSVPEGQDSISVVSGDPVCDRGEQLAAVRVEGTIRLADPDGG